MKLAGFDYTFLFQPIQNHSTSVGLINHSEDRRDFFTVSMDDNSLPLSTFPIVSSINADLLDLALAIHAADRLIKRGKEVSFSFRVELPVRNPDIFMRSDIQDLLTKVLEWYTNDYWHFEFSKREALGRNVEVQAQIPWRNLSSKNIETALWSGGLDSLAGLYTRLLAKPDTYHILVGTGSNSQVHKRQRYIAQEIDRLF